jgi:hypothetical protein
MQANRARIAVVEKFMSAARFVLSSPAVNRFFLGFRVRAFSVALISFALAAVAPPGIKGFAGFIQAPPGLAVVALALVAIGLSVEETGTIKRIRVGIALRLLAAPILVAACAWAMVLGSPTPGLATMGVVLGAIGAVGFGIALQYDWAAYADVRHGQSVKLVHLSKAGIDLETTEGRATIALSDLLGVRAVAGLDGRAVVFLVKEEARDRSDLAAVPWVGATPDGDAFVLTEHQAGMDAEQLTGRIIVMVSALQQESSNE